LSNFCLLPLESQGSSSTPISGTSVDSGVEDPDDYDHTVTWVTNGKNKMAQVIPNPMLLKPQNNEKDML
jgi:hypothetical protein